MSQLEIEIVDIYNNIMDFALRTIRLMAFAAQLYLLSVARSIPHLTKRIHTNNIFNIFDCTQNWQNDGWRAILLHTQTQLTCQFRCRLSYRYTPICYRLAAENSSTSFLSSLQQISMFIFNSRAIFQHFRCAVISSPFAIQFLATSFTWQCHFTHTHVS